MFQPIYNRVIHRTSSIIKYPNDRVYKHNITKKVAKIDNPDYFPFLPFNSYIFLISFSFILLFLIILLTLKPQQPCLCWNFATSMERLDPQKSICPFSFPHILLFFLFLSLEKSLASLFPTFRLICAVTEDSTSQI